jgi:predicted transcriptional regulator
MSQPPTLQAIIEFVEALSEDDQDVLFDLIHKRRIAKRRQEIAQNARVTMQAVSNGTAQRGTATELMANIFGDEE